MPVVLPLVIPVVPVVMNLLQLYVVDQTSSRRVFEILLIFGHFSESSPGLRRRRDFPDTLARYHQPHHHESEIEELQPSFTGVYSAPESGALGPHRPSESMRSWPCDADRRRQPPTPPTPPVSRPWSSLPRIQQHCAPPLGSRSIAYPR